MLYIIRDITDNFLKLIREDPIRPHIPQEQRIGKNRGIYLNRELDIATAITCVSFQNKIPEDEDQLFENTDEPGNAIFYTIWSYRAGKGRELLLDTVNHIKNNNKNVKRFVTLSPKTEMARRFHLNNGATILRENADTINYEYVISS